MATQTITDTNTTTTTNTTTPTRGRCPRTPGGLSKQQDATAKCSECTRLDSSAVAVVGGGCLDDRRELFMIPHFTEVVILRLVGRG